jgi:uncharacterized membrane protein YhaH (DUF805 family)
MNWYLKVLSQYADFKGRARRKEYWMFTLFHVIIFFVLLFLGGSNIFYDSYYENTFDVTSIILILYFLATLIPTIAVTVRRLHDTGKSGWLYLIVFIPYVGNFILLILVCFDSQYGANKWGDNPKGKGNKDIIEQIGVE